MFKTLGLYNYGCAYVTPPPPLKKDNDRIVLAAEGTKTIHRPTGKYKTHRKRKSHHGSDWSQLDLESKSSKVLSSPFTGCISK